MSETIHFRSELRHATDRSFSREELSRRFCPQRVFNSTPSSSRKFFSRLAFAINEVGSIRRLIARSSEVYGCRGSVAVGGPATPNTSTGIWGTIIMEANQADELPAFKRRGSCRRPKPLPNRISLRIWGAGPKMPPNGDLGVSGPRTPASRSSVAICSSVAIWGPRGQKCHPTAVQ